MTAGSVPGTDACPNSAELTIGPVYPYGSWNADRQGSCLPVAPLLDHNADVVATRPIRGPDG